MTALSKINELIQILSHKSNQLSFRNAVNLIQYRADYHDQHIPDGRFISGTFDIDNDWIIVYQAFNKDIANYAVKHQKFIGCDHYSRSRMTWIKTNFLWMMYRCDWAQRDRNQTNVLAIFLKLSDNGFIELVKSANKHKSKLADRVNLQWDPHHKPDGNSIVNKRAIQLGIKGSFNMEEFHQNIIKIEDITDFVRAISE